MPAGTGEGGEDEEVKEGEEQLADGQEEEEEEEEEGEDAFINNHDLIGVKGIIEHQRNEIEKKKVSLTNLIWTYVTATFCFR